MKRKRQPKTVRCTVRLIVGGVTRKTVRRRMTMPQALRELGGDPVETEGRLLCGVPLNKKRSLVRGVSVVLLYVADHRPRPEPMTWEADLQGAAAVIRAGIPL